LAAQAVQFALDLGVEADRNRRCLHVLPCNTYKEIAQVWGRC
jgi:hypothetical protein